MAVKSSTELSVKKLESRVECKESCIAKAVLKEENKAEWLTLSTSKPNYKAAMINPV